MNVNKEIKVAIADDHDIFRDGLKRLLKKLKPLQLQIIGDVSNGAAVIELVKITSPDLIFMDVQMPGMDGIATTKRIKSTNPEVKIIAITTFNNPSTVKSMLDAGVDGYLLKNTTKEEIAEAIAIVYSGGKFFALDEQVQCTVKEYATCRDSAQAIWAKLSKQEREILRCICHEMSNKEVAATLHINARTVETYRKRMMQKVGVRNSAGLVMFAITKGIVPV
jgi:DNA-binding NarL/FixJ family response regulator